MTWRPLGTTGTGADEWFTYDTTEKRAIIKTHQDVEPVIEQNKAAQNLGNNGFTADRSMRRIAQVPFVVAQMWSTKHGLKGTDIMKKEHSALLQRELKDPDNRMFLTVDNNRFQLRK